jgi:hypothetical protein
VHAPQGIGVNPSDSLGLIYETYEKGFFFCSFCLIKKNQKIKALNKFSGSSTTHSIEIYKLSRLCGIKQTNFDHYASLRTSWKIF